MASEAGRWWGRPLAEMRWQAELTRLCLDPMFLRGAEPRGDGRTVVLVPGFAGGDWTLQHLAFWLRRSGYAPARCNFLVNAGCPAKALARVERRVLECSERSGRRVAVLGHSAGGYLARAAAARLPDHVSHAVALGAGLSRQFDVSAPALAAVAFARAVQPNNACLTEHCGCAFTAGYASPFPATVRLTSIYSRGDGMVRWQSCLADYADNVEVTGSHVGLAWNRKSYRAIATALAQPERTTAL
jgi:pimeloyl-ACP methyl ester carboxylesterase